MTVEIVAVRWSCFSCEATAIAAPADLPRGWFEKPAPLWRGQHESRFYCPDHAERGRELHGRQLSAYAGRTHVVSVEEYETLKATVRQAAYLLDRLKFSGQRAADREIV